MHVTKVMKILAFIFEQPSYLCGFCYNEFTYILNFIDGSRHHTFLVCWQVCFNLIFYLEKSPAIIGAYETLNSSLDTHKKKSNKKQNFFCLTYIYKYLFISRSYIAFCVKQR